MHAPGNNNRKIFTAPLHVASYYIEPPECKVQGWSNSYVRVMFVVRFLSACDRVAKSLCGWLTLR